MSFELIRTRTTDGVLLDGSLQRGEAADRAGRQVVWLLLHGTGGNFYSRGVLEKSAEQLAADGQAVARVNTRGHDVISSVPGRRGQPPDGAAFETISDCVHDVRAWVDELIRRDFSAVVLVGHSMGGVKAIFSQVHDPHPNVMAIVGVSPPRFCHAEWQSSPLAQAFREHFQLATELVAAGRGDELMLVEQPLPLYLTASGFLAKYGPHDDYDFVPLLPKLTVPTLLIVGTESVETSPAFSSTPAAVQKLQRSWPNLTFQLVQGANTGYSKHLDVPGQLAIEWFRSVVNRGHSR
jgi:pimeloyl-ACP methyl ester carboxylesterase